MRSHLTRHVFRRLLSNEVFIYHECPYGSLPRYACRSPSAAVLRPPPRRSLFGFGRKPDRKAKAVDLDPGLGKMLELNISSKEGRRPPPPVELIQAFRAFFRAKEQTREPLQEIQAIRALQTFRHLQALDPEWKGFGLSLEDLELARDALVWMPKDNTSTHNQFARLLFEEIKTRKEEDPSLISTIGTQDLLPLVKVLCYTGDSLEARGLVGHYWSDDFSKNNRRLWTFLLKGFAKEKNEAELVQTVNLMESRGVPFDAKAHQILTNYFALNDDVANAKKWYEHPIAENESPTYPTNATILRFCMRNDEMEWGDKIFESVLNKNPNKSTWDIIFLWAAALGRGVDELDRIMGVMVRRNEGNSNIRADVDTINALVEFANQRNDPYSAERYVALGQKWDVQPNGRTYILQMDYRISVGDIDGARTAYRNLQAEEIEAGEDIPVLNKLITAMCGMRRVDHNAIMDLVEDLNERKARLEPDTLCALCQLHLRREEFDDVIDLLQAHTFHYSMNQRARVCDVFVSFCLDRSNSTALIWEAYTIFRHIFAETPVETRTHVMREFFARGRSDMAVHVFGHMRQSQRPEWRPTLDTYVQCLEGIARAADLEGLETVHNMLKLDMDIEPNTRLYNALMLGYTACEMPRRSLDYWDDITKSREGPTYSSIQIAFRACEAAPFGDKQARAIWQRLRTLEIEVNTETFAAYVGALAGQSLYDEVIKTIDGMEKDIGYKPDALVLGTFYNAIPGQNQKDLVEEWGLKTYPEAWQDLSALGQMSRRDGSRAFKINREVKP
ncbi:MAG: hypothetical protein M1819_000976 [Sarea resinae]|nr:MAG: hypothetical protein M1819_000976 [Sarea resinae]